MTKLAFECKYATTHSGEITGVEKTSSWLLLNLDNITGIEAILVQHENNPLGVMLSLHGEGYDGNTYQLSDMPIIHDADFRTLMNCFQAATE